MSGTGFMIGAVNGYRFADGTPMISIPLTEPETISLIKRFTLMQNQSAFAGPDSSDPAWVDITQLHLLSQHGWMRICRCVQERDYTLRAGFYRPAHVTYLKDMAARLWEGGSTCINDTNRQWRLILEMFDFQHKGKRLRTLELREFANRPENMFFRIYDDIHKLCSHFIELLVERVEDELELINADLTEVHIPKHVNDDVIVLEGLGGATITIRPKNKEISVDKDH